MTESHPAEKARTMNYWLGRRLRRAREAANLSRRQLAAHIPGRKGEPVDVSTLSRLESGDTWTPHPDVTVATYGLLCEVDARLLWKQAASDFMRLGGTPHAGRELSAPERALLLAQGAAGQTPSDGRSEHMPTSIRSLRAGS